MQRFSKFVLSIVTKTFQASDRFATETYQQSDYYKPDIWTTRFKHQIRLTQHCQYLIVISYRDLESNLSTGK